MKVPLEEYVDKPRLSSQVPCRMSTDGFTVTAQRCRWITTFLQYPNTVTFTQDGLVRFLGWVAAIWDLNCGIHQKFPHKTIAHCRGIQYYRGIPVWNIYLPVVNTSEVGVLIAGTPTDCQNGGSRSPPGHMIGARRGLNGAAGQMPLFSQSMALMETAVWPHRSSIYYPIQRRGDKYFRLEYHFNKVHSQTATDFIPFFFSLVVFQ